MGSEEKVNEVDCKSDRSFPQDSHCVQIDIGYGLYTEDASEPDLVKTVGDIHREYWL